MTRPPQAPTRPPTRIGAHAAPAVVLAVWLLAVAPGADRSALQPSEPSSSTSPSATCDPEALTLHARLDPDRLGRGGPAGGIARLRLEVEGTDAPVRIELINRTPGVVGLEGGDVQISTSTGGADNRLEREIRTHRAGDLEIRYHLAAAPCPTL